MEEIIATAIGALLTELILYTVAIAAAQIIIQVIIIRAIIKYAAKKNAEAFHYDELAKKIAGEIMRTQLYMIKHQPTPVQQPPIYTQPTQQAQPINQPANQKGDAAPEPRRYRPPGL